MQESESLGDKERPMQEVNSETKRILAAISQEQWLAYYHELVIYAERKCKRLYWRAGPRDLPGGHTAETVVEEAIKRLFEGKRGWNHERYPGVSPVAFLKGVVDSLISALVESEDHKRTAFLEDTRTRTASAGGDYEFPVSPAVDDVTGFRPEEPIDPEKAFYLSEMVQRMERAIADRKDLLIYFRHSGEGRSASEISELMGIEITAVYQLKKLLLARLKPLAAELLGK
jgi:DNA-directed RNA polymerase specialized sigma24 family protein